MAVVAGAVVGGMAIWRKYHPAYNVLIITLDTTRADHLGCYGDTKANTPNLDSVAELGVRFEQAFSAVPLTLPSHATMMTGLYPPEHGARVNGMHRLGEGIPTLAEAFKQHGYKTAAFVAAFVLDKRFGLKRGFDTYDDYKVPETKDPYTNNMYKYRRGDLVADSALAWLKEHSSKPFFCWVHFYDPHRPHYFKKDPYNKSITFMDKQVGRILKYLRERRLMSKTLVILVADHGEGLGEHNEDEHGLLLQPAVMQVPLLMCQPGRLPAGKTVDTPVSLVDLFPTTMELMGWKMTTRTSGRSFAPTLADGKLTERALYMETEFPFTEYGWSPLAAVIRSEWKYVKSPQEELYNRVEDPTETNNAVITQSEVADEMRGELDATMKAMAVRQNTKIKLDKEAQEALESLGYVGGGGSSETNATLRDVKDVIGLRRDFTNVMGLEERKEYDAAEKLFRAIIEKSPETYMFQYKLATMLYRQGKYKAACEEYEQVARKYPEQYQPHYTFGTSLIQIGRYERAVEELRLAMKIDSHQLPCYNNLGIALLKSGEVYEAMDVFKESIELHPRQTEPHNNLGTILLTQGDLKGAEKEFQTAIEVDSDYVDGHYNLGLCLLAQNRFKEAAVAFRQTLELKPDHPYVGDDVVPDVADLYAVGLESPGRGRGGAGGSGIGDADGGRIADASGGGTDGGGDGRGRGSGVVWGDPGAGVFDGVGDLLCESADDVRRRGCQRDEPRRRLPPDADGQGHCRRQRLLRQSLDDLRQRIRPVWGWGGTAERLGGCAGEFLLGG
jgi:arylsulfatase A-like enzyme/Tfp pilus assembly protein PilF